MLILNVIANFLIVEITIISRIRAEISPDVDLSYVKLKKRKKKKVMLFYKCIDSSSRGKVYQVILCVCVCVN